MLEPPFEDGNFALIEQLTSGTILGKQEILSVLWQLRHSIVHNFGVVTQSDAVKLSRLCKRQINGDVQLDIRRTDFWYVKLFIMEFAEAANSKVHTELQNVLTNHFMTSSDDADKLTKAQEVANLFGITTNVGGQTGTPPP